jgi:hypothetical protein
MVLIYTLVAMKYFSILQFHRAEDDNRFYIQSGPKDNLKHPLVLTEFSDLYLPVNLENVITGL